MPINLAAAAFGGVIGTVVGAALAAGTSAYRGEPITWRVVAAGAARGGATGFIGGLTFGLGLIPGALGGATGAVVGEALAAWIGRTVVTRKDLAVAAVTGLVGAALLNELAPAKTLFAPPVRVTVVSAAASGAGAGAAGQTAANLLHDRPLFENVTTATALGAATGALVGGAARGLQERLAHLRAKTDLQLARARATAPPAEPAETPAQPDAPRPGSFEAIVQKNVLRNLEASPSPDAARVLEALRDGRLSLHVNEDPPVGVATPNDVYVTAGWESTQPETLRRVIEEGLTKLNFHDQLAALDGPGASSRGMASALSDLDARSGNADRGPTTPARVTATFEDFVRSGVFDSLERDGSPEAARVWKALDDGRLVLRVNRDAPAIAAARPNEIDIDIPYRSSLDHHDVTLRRVLALAGPRLDALEGEALPLPSRSP